MAHTTEIRADSVADYLITQMREHGDPITNKKLQKLLYYAQGWFLALYDEQLFFDPIEAWTHGPVVPDVWQRFRDSEWRPIMDEIVPPEFPEQVTEHLDEVLIVYGTLEAYELELLTHQEKPWQIARGDLPHDAPCNNTIEHDHMRDFYKSMAEANVEENS